MLSSTDDVAQPPSGILTLRSALDQAASGDTINFDTSLNGATIELNLIGVNHSTLLGETYSGMTFQGYAERDYGKSAIYAKKNIELDATSLPNGITIKWTGGDTNPARVLAVYGDLILRNVNITGGYSQAEAISNSTAQPYTLARGGGVAVWGTLTLDHSAIYGNKIVGDTESSRDRGTYGGGIYANGLDLTDCIVAGNSAKGYGAAGGGIYIGGGSLKVISSTIAENQVNGPVAIFNGKPNIGGGGVAATIGNAHVVEDVQLEHSIVIGNTMNGTPADWFTGSLINFYSYGYNRIGSIDFSQILVPCPEWNDLSRRHYPEPGDRTL